MATTVYLIRHGETEDADSRRYKGRIDAPLSENGIEQIKRLADYFFQNSELGTQNSELKAVYCSGLIRSVRSAEIIAGAYGLEPVVVEGLKERNFGVWEGMSFDEIKEKWPDAFDAWARNPLRFSPMGGESTIEVRERALKAFDEIMQKHDGDNVAIVAHGGVNRVILCELLGMPLENIFRIEQDFAALNVIEMWDYPVVKHINYVV
ncbi:MAG TPA: alpha-ribazole phosphatase [Nitrospirae bacterium]|nr:alpha-ribazole phosphatase [Nitrospirota bacterium]